MIESRSRFIDLPGRRLHVLEWDRVESPLLILLHGIRDHAHSWDWIASELASSYRILAPDLRGHGDSSWTGAYNLPDYVIDLADLVSKLGLSSFNLVGHSLGGHICARYAASFPEFVSSLCVVEGVELPIIRDQRSSPRSYPARLREWIERETDRAQRLPRTYPTLAEAEARMAAAHPANSLDVVAHLTQHGTITQGRGGFRWKYDNAARYRAPEDSHGVDLDEILAAIACPTLLIYGEKSWIPLPPIERLARIANFRVVVFQETSHWPHLQSQGQFLETLMPFLKAPKMFIKNGRYRDA